MTGWNLCEIWRLSRNCSENKRHHHLMIQWRDKVASNSQREIVVHPYDQQKGRRPYGMKHNEHLTSPPLSCAFVHLFQAHHMAFRSCIASKERGTYVTSRWEGSNSCTSAPHPSSCTPFVQQLAGWGRPCVFLGDSLILWALTQMRSKVITLKQNTVKPVKNQVHLNVPDVSVCRKDSFAAGSHWFNT